MNPNTLNPSGQPDLPPLVEAETENLSGVYVHIDAVCDTTRRPNRGSIATQMRPDPPRTPPDDKGKQG